MRVSMKCVVSCLYMSVVQVWIYVTKLRLTMCVVHHFALGDGMISIKPITMPYMAYRVGHV